MRRLHSLILVACFVGFASGCVVRECPEPVHYGYQPVPPAPPAEPAPAEPGDGAGQPGSPGTARACVTGGCSNQLCVEEGEEAITTCEYRPEYACYQSATCERQPNGQCGWTPTPELQQCLANPPAP